MKRLLIFLLLASPAMAQTHYDRFWLFSNGGGGQTHTFPALDTNNAFTGTNSFSGAVTFTGGVGVVGEADFSAALSTGITTFYNTNTPGVAGQGWGLFFQQNNSAGTKENAVFMNPGFATVTAGAEQSVVDWQFYIGGTQRVLAMGGIVGGGTTGFFTPSDDNIWSLGQATARWKQGWIVNFATVTQTFQGTTAPSVGSATQEVSYFDTTTVTKKASYGGNPFFVIPQTANAAGTHSDSGFYQSKRAVAGCTTGAAAGNSCGTDITVTWGTAFADANYSVTCTGSTPTNVPSAPFVVSASKLAASVHINYFAITAAAASYSTIDCIAVHD